MDAIDEEKLRVVKEAPVEIREDVLYALTRCLEEAAAGGPFGFLPGDLCQDTVNLIWEVAMGQKRFSGTASFYLSRRSQRALKAISKFYFPGRKRK